MILRILVWLDSQPWHVRALILFGAAFTAFLAAGFGVFLTR